MCASTGGPKKWYPSYIYYIVREVSLFWPTRYMLTYMCERRRNTCTHTIVHLNFAAGAVAKYCDEHVYVCLSVRADISGTTCAIFTTSLCMLPMAVTWSSSCVFAIRYVFPVLWLTSCFNGPYSGNKRPERRSRGQFYGTETKILASRPN